MAENDPGGITIASYLLPPAGLLGKLGNLAKLGKLGNLLGKSGKLLGAKLGALLGKTGKSLKSIANKVIRWVTDPVDPVTGAYCDERTDFTLGQTLPLSFTRFHSSVLPLHGLTGVGWSDSWSEYAWVREQGNRVDIISLGATLNFAFDGESDTAVNPYHAQYILRRRDDYLELFDRDALSSRFFYDAFPGMRLRHPVTDDTSDDRLAHSPADRMYMLGGMSDTASTVTGVLPVSRAGMQPASLSPSAPDFSRRKPHGAGCSPHWYGSTVTTARAMCRLSPAGKITDGKHGGNTGWTGTARSRR